MLAQTCRSSLDLKRFREDACTTDEGSEFQLLIARTLMTCLRALDVAWGLNSFQGWPRFVLVDAWETNSSGSISSPARSIWHMAIMSPRRLWWYRDGSLRYLSLSGYGLLLMFSTSLVARLCIRSTSFSSARLNEPHIRLPYSRCGLTRVLKSNGSVISLMFAKDRRTRARIWMAFDVWYQEQSESILAIQ